MVDIKDLEKIVCGESLYSENLLSIKQSLLINEVP